MLLGVRAVIAESFERIHRSNLIGMGVLPLQFIDGQQRQLARTHRPGALRDHRLRTAPSAAAPRGGHAGQRRTDPLRGARAHRHAEGARILPSRRHPAVTCCASSRARAVPPDDVQVPADARLAVFDLDGTITRHDTLDAVRAAAACGAALAAAAIAAGAAAARCAICSIAIAARFKGALLHATLGGLTRARAWSAGPRASCPRLLRAGPVCRGTHAPSATHRSRGDRLLLMSASTDLYVPRIGRRSASSETICSRGALARATAGSTAGWPRPTAAARRSAAAWQALIARDAPAPRLCLRQQRCRSAAHAVGATSLHGQSVVSPCRAARSSRAGDSMEPSSRNLISRDPPWPREVGC